MLYSTIDELQAEINALYGRMGALAGIWNDRVSRALDATYLNALRGECSSFHGEAYDMACRIREAEDELKRITGKY